MAISTYAELQTAVSNRAKITGGADYSARVPEYIALCEAEINRKCRVFRQQQLATVSYTTSDTDRRIALPSDFVETLGLHIKPSTYDDVYYDKVRYVAPERMVDRYKSTAGQPRSYTVRRNEIEFERVADQSYTLRMHYIGRWDIATDTTNWLLTYHPDVYLFGALAHCMIDRAEEKKEEFYRAKFTDALAAVNMVDERTSDDAELSVAEVGMIASTGTRYEIASDE